ncbi:methyl-accepting chemotaxis protein [Pigmentibacter sp. JX0631]|uniref:methyl-accepting chemotaxis protein n=1 Tax=Pigmentibacter sp. JX0631 TaxID=2976982 RepID=UPI0024685C2F|nr:methyl-accepting chemotaxis protein [Pigmentibacter sp. JX0631]WGL61100.1 methyl-accepting chemotaxis protein [Pigmentibacter sp. JX0631]
MKWTIGYKITGLIFILISIFVILSIITYKSTLQLMDSYSSISHSNELINEIEKLRSTMYYAETGKRGYVITAFDHYLTPFNEAANKIDKHIENIRNYIQENKTQIQRLNALKPLLTEKMNEHIKAIELRNTTSYEASKEYLIMVNKRNVMDKINVILNEMSAEAKNKLSIEEKNNEAAVESTKLLFYIRLFISTLSLVIAFIYIKYTISNQLIKITELVGKISVGELPKSVESSNRQDEIGDLYRAFAQMNQYIRETSDMLEEISKGNINIKLKAMSDKDVLRLTFSRMVAYLHKVVKALDEVAKQNLRYKIDPESKEDILGHTLIAMVEKLNIIINRLKEGSQVLSKSATEIMSVTSQVAAAATETSGSVRETIVTIEEVKQTAQLSTQKAKNVSDTAKRASEVSLLGAKSVDDSISGMGEIKKQMETIAESIMKLSEQSLAIGDITSAVNDLAEQSNLLSVNASIEAAKAGELGRGFAVVAQEVKALAEQSKQATTQIRTILNDVQKATAKAVLTAEQGGKAVELGMKQVLQSGESIKTLSESISEAAQVSNQIAASSQQQLIGVDQVVIAIQNINQATNQNVTATKQVEVSAGELNRLGLLLKEIVDEFRV